MESSACETKGSEYVPADADAPPLGVIADDEDCGWPRPSVVAYVDSGGP